MPKPRIHLIFSRKGGVGKTTICVNLAATVAAVLNIDPEDVPVLVASLDPQNSAGVWVAASERRGGELLPFNFERIPETPEAVRQLADADYQHVFIDCPGSVARPAALAEALELADDVLVPMIPDALSYEPTEYTVKELILPKGKPYAVVPSLWDPRDGDVDLRALRDWCDGPKVGLRCTKTVIRRYRQHATMAAAGKVVTQYPKSRTTTEAKNDFLNLALELGYGTRMVA